MNIGRKISATIGITLMCGLSMVTTTVGELLVIRTRAYKYQIWRDWSGYTDFLKSVWIKEETPDPDAEPCTYYIDATGKKRWDTMDCKGGIEWIVMGSQRFKRESED